MSLLQNFLSANPSIPDKGKIKIWVLAPYIASSDENIDYYYDFSQSIEEYTRAFNELGLVWKWQPVTMGNFKAVLRMISLEKKEEKFFPIVLNLCDGDETNKTPGISVIKALEEHQLIFTGADEYFYSITTSKIPMKKAFDDSLVPNARWMPIESLKINTQEILDKIGTTIIIKPAVSGGSMGVGVKNVVETKEELEKVLEDLFKGYRGWNLTSDGLIAEAFIEGEEYTVFISGSYNRPTDANIYMPVERVFHPSLSEKEKFLSFDRLWEIYETESSMPRDENFYEYAIPEVGLLDSLKKISWEAFVSNKGMGYGRVDLRRCRTTKKIFVLEVNAQCGLSEDENFTSIGAILKFSDKSFSSLIEEIIVDGLTRGQLKKIL